MTRMRFPLRTLAMAALALGATVLASGAVNAAQSGNVSLGGSAAANCNITVNDGAVAIDLAASQTNLLVATVDETCNKRAGYSISVATANGTTSGMFKSSTDPITNTDTMSFSVTYDGNPVTFVSGSGTGKTLAAKNAGSTSNVTITYTGDPTMEPASNSDTLTFTMTVN